MTCSGCGLRSCSGDCYLESDPDAVEFYENLKKLSERYGDSHNGFTKCEGDPLRQLEPKHDRRAA